MCIRDSDHATAKRDQAAALIQGQAGQAGATAAMAAIATAADALIRAEAQVAALVAPSQQADLALSEAARTLRLHLEPGAPCPVCGSAEHPIHADAALANLATRLRADMARARKDEQEARSCLLYTSRCV